MTEMNNGPSAQIGGFFRILEEVMRNATFGPSISPVASTSTPTRNPSVSPIGRTLSPTLGKELVDKAVNVILDANANGTQNTTDLEQAINTLLSQGYIFSPDPWEPSGWGEIWAVVICSVLIFSIPGTVALTNHLKKLRLRESSIPSARANVCATTRSICSMFVRVFAHFVFPSSRRDRDVDRLGVEGASILFFERELGRLLFVLAVITNLILVPLHQSFTVEGEDTTMAATEGTNLLGEGRSRSQHSNFIPWTIQNVPVDSAYGVLWVHVAFVYLITLLTLRFSNHVLVSLDLTEQRKNQGSSKSSLGRDNGEDDDGDQDDGDDEESVVKITPHHPHQPVTTHGGGTNSDASLFVEGQVNFFPSSEQDLLRAMELAVPGHVQSIRIFEQRTRLKKLGEFRSVVTFKRPDFAQEFLSARLRKAAIKRRFQALLQGAAAESEQATGRGVENNEEEEEEDFGDEMTSLTQRRHSGDGVHRIHNSSNVNASMSSRMNKKISSTVPDDPDEDDEEGDALLKSQNSVYENDENDDVEDDGDGSSAQGGGMTSATIPTHRKMLRRNRNSQQQPPGPAFADLEFFSAVRMERWSVQRAPDPDDIMWDALSVDRTTFLLRSGCVNVTIVVALFVFTTPIAFISFVSGVTSPQVSSGLLATYVNIVANLRLLSPALGDFIFSFLPQLLLVVCDAWLLFALQMASKSIEPHYTHSGRETSLFRKSFWFLIFNTLLLPSLAFSNIGAFVGDLFQNEASPFSLLGRAFATSSGAFTLTFIPTQTWVGASMDVTRLSERLFFMARGYSRPWASAEERRAARLPQFEFDYGTEYAMCLTMFSLCIVFSTVVPPILFFGVSYFIVKQATDDHCLRHLVTPQHIDKLHRAHVARAAVKYLVVAVALLQSSIFGFLSSEVCVPLNSLNGPLTNARSNLTTANHSSSSSPAITPTTEVIGSEEFSLLIPASTARCIANDHAGVLILRGSFGQIIALVFCLVCTCVAGLRAIMKQQPLKPIRSPSTTVSASTASSSRHLPKAGDEKDIKEGDKMMEPSMDDGR